MRDRCPVCGCDAANGAHAHAVQAALAIDDLDAALAHGLLDPEIHCRACSDACRRILQVAADGRRDALSARDRFRAREARLARRRQERAARSGATAPASSTGGSAYALPAAAAAALARAKAKAASPRKS